LAGAVLSGSNFALFAIKLPVFANMFTIHGGSAKKAWNYKRRLAVDKKNCELQSLGRTWARSGSIEKVQGSKLKV
jgi:hypothetical protein